MKAGAKVLELGVPDRELSRVWPLRGRLDVECANVPAIVACDWVRECDGGVEVFESGE
jgi:hypothetical protein